MPSESGVWLCRRIELRRLEGPRIMLIDHDRGLVELSDHYHAAALHVAQYAASWPDLILRLTAAAGVDFDTAEKLLLWARDGGWLQPAESLPAALCDDGEIPQDAPSASTDEEMLEAAGHWMRIGTTRPELPVPGPPRCWTEYLLDPPPPGAQDAEATVIWRLSASQWHRRRGLRPPLALQSGSDDWEGWCASSPRHWRGHGWLNGHYCLPPLTGLPAADYACVLAQLFPECWLLCGGSTQDPAAFSSTSVPTGLGLAVSTLATEARGLEAELRYRQLAVQLQTLAELSGDAFRSRLLQGWHEDWQTHEQWLYAYDLEPSPEALNGPPPIHTATAQESCRQYADRLRRWPRLWESARARKGLSPAP